MLESQKASKEGAGGAKKSAGGAGNDARREMTKTKEQLEEEKKIALSIRIKPLELESLDSDEIKAKAEELFKIIVQLETDKYDYEQEKKLNQQKKEEEEKLRKEENEKKAREGADKKKSAADAGGGDARREMSKTKEQLEEEKKIALSIRLKPLELEAMDSDELKAKATEIHNII